MNRKTAVVIAVVLVLVAAAVVLWLLLSKPADQTGSQQTPATNTPSTDPITQPDPSSEQPLGNTTVDIVNFTFSPAVIKVKKGSTVTWVNQDSIGHNVVASDSNNSGGLPASAGLLSKGQSFSFTFNQTGTFEYLCQPHAASMRGTVEVVE